MVDIESSLGRRSFAESSQKRVLTVDDPTQPRHNLRVTPEELQAQGGFQRGLPREMFENVPQMQPQQQQMRQMPRDLTEDEIAELNIRRQEALMSSGVTKQARERFEYLTGKCRVEADLEVDGNTFHFQSLKSGELEEIFEVMLSTNLKSEHQIKYELRRQVLARSLIGIDNMSLHQAIGSSTIEENIDFIRNLDENLVTVMYRFYENNIVKVSKEKYDIKNEEDAREVAETVKK